VLAAACLRWLCDLIAPWSIIDDITVFYFLCCLAATPLVALAAFVCFVIWATEARPSLQRLSSYGVAPILLGVFVFFSLPLVEALLTPIESRTQMGPPVTLLDAETGEARYVGTEVLTRKGPLDRNCGRVRERILEYSGGVPSRFCETTDSWRDVDGDGDKERWERIEAKTGANGFGSAVFIYGKGESAPRWCGDVAVRSWFYAAWIRPINLDLDLAPEIWMRNAVYRPQTYAFLDFSANGVREFDPRMSILLILLPIRMLPLATWFWLRHKPIASVLVAVITPLIYVLIS
jgi:hypothetical protein